MEGAGVVVQRARGVRCGQEVATKPVPEPRFKKWEGGNKKRLRTVREAQVEHGPVQPSQSAPCPPTSQGRTRNCVDMTQWSGAGAGGFVQRSAAPLARVEHCSLAWGQRF